MPFRPKTFRPSTVSAARSYDQDRRLRVPTRRLYGTAAWRAVAADQLRAFPFCAFCATAGRAVSATTCDHVIPHRGDIDAFWSGPFQSLCTPCHASAKQRAEAQGRG